jgi:hypothetical protein
MMKSPSRSYDFLWLSLALLPLLFIALLIPLTPHDYWWYLRLGQDVVMTGAVPSIETYSFTQAGHTVINQPWLGAVFLWFIYDLGGLDLTFLLRALLIGSSYGLLWVWIRQQGAGPRVATLLTVLAGLAGSNNWAFRPQLFGFLFYVLVILLLWHWNQGGSNRLLWLLPIIACLWMNIHGSFLLLFLLGGAALLFGTGNRKTLFILLIISFLATLVSPYGITNWKIIADGFLVPSSQALSTEWIPTVDKGWQLNIFYIWVLLPAPLAGLSSRRLTIMEWAWLLGLLWIAFSGVRYVVWGLFMLAMATGKLLAAWDTHWFTTAIEVRRPSVNYALGIFILLIPLIGLPSIRQASGLQVPPVLSAETPVQAVDWLAQHPNLSGAMWSDLAFSSYLIYALPSRPVWVDTRFEMVYPAEQYEKYSTISSGAPGWQDLLVKDDINLLFLSRQSQPGLIQQVDTSEDWCKMYRDPVAVIFIRKIGSCP